MLAHIVSIIRRLQEAKCVDLSVRGNISKLSQDDVDHILPVFEYVSECIDTSGDSIFTNTITNYLGQDVFIEINTGSVKGYFETFASFIKKNTAELKEDIFYIRDINVFCNPPAEDAHEKLTAYRSNLTLIQLLKDVSDYEKRVGNELELFFYKTENGLTLNINYSEKDLDGLSLGKLNDLKEHFSTSHNREERKQIFINELINLLRDDSSYSSLLIKWDELINKYEKSFKLYLEGFSFEKIKTASTHYLQELTDRVFDQINKATTNIFIVPTAYIFLIKSFELTGSLLQNVLLLITAFIFSLLMHKVIFVNMSENLAAIKVDINDFRRKIDETETLKRVLDGLENNKIEKQNAKIQLLKWCNWILFMFAVVTFFHTDSTKFMHFIETLGCK